MGPPNQNDLRGSFPPIGHGQHQNGSPRCKISALPAAAPVLAGTALTRKQISLEIAKVPGHRGAVWTIDLQEGVREKKQVLSIFSKYQRGPKPYLLAIFTQDSSYRFDLYGTYSGFTLGANLYVTAIRACGCRELLRAIQST